MTAVILTYSALWIYATMCAFTFYICDAGAPSLDRAARLRIVLAVIFWPAFWIYVLIGAIYDMARARHV